jgi:hypothetical protein
VTTLYRRARAEQPAGRGSLWTTSEASTDFLAGVEAGTPTLPDDLRLYQRDVLIGEREVAQPVDQVLGLVEGKPMLEALPALRDALLGFAEKHAATGYEWMRLTLDGNEWHGAIVYLSGEPMAMQVLPPVNG